MILIFNSTFLILFVWYTSTDWAAKLAGDRTHEWGSWWLLRSKSNLQTLSDSPQFYVFLQKRAFFRFCGRDPSKMTILAPSRKTVRIGLYRGVEKGPKSTFFGWSVFGVLGIFWRWWFLQLFLIHCRSQNRKNVVDDKTMKSCKKRGIVPGDDFMIL